MTKSRSFLAVAVVAAMTAAGCGGDGPSTDGPETTPDPTVGESGDGAAPDVTEVDEPGSDGEQVTEPADGDDPNDAVDLSRLSGEGTFSVDGEQRQTEWVVRCAPSDEFGGNPDERDLELIAYSDEGGFLTLNVGVEDLEGMGENNYTYTTFGLDWGQSVVEEEIAGFITGPAGDWYYGEASILLARDAQTSDPLDPPPFTIEDDRVTGDVDIAAFDAEQPDGATIGFDLSIPPESVDCSQL